MLICRIGLGVGELGPCRPERRITTATKARAAELTWRVRMRVKPGCRRTALVKPRCCSSAKCSRGRRVHRRLDRQIGAGTRPVVDRPTGQAPAAADRSAAHRCQAQCRPSADHDVHRPPGWVCAKNPAAGSAAHRRQVRVAARISWRDPRRRSYPHFRTSQGAGIPGRAWSRAENRRPLAHGRRRRYDRHRVRRSRVDGGTVG